MSVNFLHHELSRLSSKSTCTPDKGLKTLNPSKCALQLFAFSRHRLTFESPESARIPRHLKYHFHHSKMEIARDDLSTPFTHPTRLSIKFTSIPKFSVSGKNRAISRDLPFHNSRTRPISSFVPPSVHRPARFSIPFLVRIPPSTGILFSPSFSLFRAHGLRKVRGERAPRGLKGKKHRRWRGKHEKSWDRGGKKGGKGHVKNCTSAYISPATSGVILAISRAAVGTRTTMASSFPFLFFFFFFPWTRQVLFPPPSV